MGSEKVGDRDRLSAPAQLDRDAARGGAAERGAAGDRVAGLHRESGEVGDGAGPPAAMVEDDDIAPGAERLGVTHPAGGGGNARGVGGGLDSETAGVDAGVRKLARAAGDAAGERE